MKTAFKIALLTVTALVPSLALAQTAMPPTDDGITADGDIIVTARKRSERLQDVPVAITALDSTLIQNARIESLADVAKLTPGLIYTPLFGKQNQLPIIRGVAQTLGQLNVGVFLDGVYLSGKASVDIELNDLARVEVVKGPQSALYGRNTFAGAINYVTQRPSKEFTGRAEVTYAEQNTFKVLGSVSGPISDTLRVRLGGYYRSTDGFYTSSIDGGRVDFEKGYGGTGTIEWQPVEPLIITLRGTYSEDRDGQPASNVIRNNAGLGTPSGGSATQQRNLLFVGQLPSIPTNGVQVATTGINIVPGQTVATTTVTRPGFPTATATGLTAAFPAINFYGDRGEAFRGSGTIEYDAGPVTLTSITAYAWRKADFNYDGDNTICDRTGGCPNFGFPFAPAIAVGTNNFALSSSLQTFKDFSQEFRVASNGQQRFTWLFGFFYYRARVDSIDRSIVPTQAAANAYFFPRLVTSTDSYSAFASAAYKLTDALTISGELRYEYEKQNFTQNPTNPAGSGTLDPNVAGLFNLVQAFQFATPRVIVDYKFGGGNMIYASYARGAKTGGFNTGTNVFANQRTFQPEFQNNYELGVKTTSMGGKLKANAAVFYIDWINQQVVDQNPVTAGGTSTNRSYNTNSASSRIFGVELDAVWQPVAWFGLAANYAYTDAQYRSFVDATLNGTPGTPGNLSLAGLPNINFNGKYLPYVPRHKFVVSPTFTLPLGDEGSIEARTDVAFQSRTFLRADNLAFFSQRANVDFRLTGRYKQFFAQAFVNNLFDNKQPVAGVRFFDSVNYSVSSPYVTGPARRQIGATIGVKF